jgi:hypothetical protein
MVFGARMLRLAIMITLLVTPLTSQAGQGWYLIYPPVQYPSETETGSVRGTAPYHEWGQTAAFDTVQACERERKATDAKALETLKALGNEDQKSLLTKLRLVVTAAQVSSRCVASDDPRLRP